MSLRKIRNQFDRRENLIMSQMQEEENEEISFEEARSIGAQRVRNERNNRSFSSNPDNLQTSSSANMRTSGMGLMTELQKDQLSFEQAREIGVHNQALDYQRRIRERALKMHKNMEDQRSPYESLSQEDKKSLARLYSLQNQLKTFSTQSQTNLQGGNPALQPQNPYNADIQQEYNKLYAGLNKKGYDVTELMRYYERIKSKEAADDMKKTLTEKTADHPALMSAASVGLNLLTLQNSFPKAIQDALYDAAYGTNYGIDTNAPEFFGTYSTNAVREKASSDIVEKTREKYGDGAAWAANLLYGTGMSMADSLTANVLGGFTPVGSILQGINAANSSLVDASERGIPAGRALLTAAAAGTFEGLFEHVSLSKLKAMQPEMNSTLKAVGKNILKQMGTEGSEEAATEFANLVFDGIVNQGQSSLAMQRQAYIDQGMSSGEATGQVIWDAVKQVAEAGLGGALSGVGFGAGGALTNYAKYDYGTRQIGKESLQSGQYDARLRSALQFDPDSEIGQAAIKMVNRDRISNKAAGRFVTQYDRAATEAIQRASGEQEVEDAYRRFASDDNPRAALPLAQMADDRLEALALQKAEEERAQKQEADKAGEQQEIEEAPVSPLSQSSTALWNSERRKSTWDIRRDAKKTQGSETPDEAAPEGANSDRKTELPEGANPAQAQTESKPDGTAYPYTERDGSEWKGEAQQQDSAEPAKEQRYRTMAAAKLPGGEDVKVVDISSTEGGKAEVRLSNGKTAKLDELQFEVPEERTLYSMAKAFPTAKARAFVNHYDGSIGIENYTRAFNVLYEAGYQGKTSLVNAIQKLDGIPREQKAMLSFIYFSGENHAAAAEAKAKQERQPVERGSGRFVNKTGEKLDEAMQLLYMGTAAKAGMTIELRNQIQKDANGAFDSGLSRILLSQNADNQFVTLVHETAEYVREYNPEGMLDVQEAMLGWYAKVCDFETLAAMVEDYRSRYEGQLGEESAGEAMGEMTHDAMSALFADEAGAQDFLNWLKEDSGKTAAQQKNILQTIVELFDRLIEKISEYLHGHSLPKAANVFAEGMDLEQMAALRQMFFEAADQARKNYDAVEKRTNKKRKPSRETARIRAKAEGFAEVESGGENKTSVKMENDEEVEAEQIRNSAQEKINHQENRKSPKSIYYIINEEDARRAKQMTSFDDYQQGSATAEYQAYVDKALKIAEQQKQRVDPIYHEKIDSILDSYARKLAENMNSRYAIHARVPSVMIAGPANFPVRQKEKQNAAADRNMEEFQNIQGLLEKIRSTGTGGISADDPQAVQKLQSKLEGLEKSQETMKAVNAYYRKNGTLDGCTLLPPDQIRKLQSDMAQSWHLDKSKPFQSFALSNNNAEIRRTKERIETLKRHEQRDYAGWEFGGGRVEANKEVNRLQIFFDNKPDEATRAEMKANGFRWAPSAGAWQRQLNDNAYRAADHISYIQPTTGEKPTALLRQAQQQVETTGSKTLSVEKEGSKDLKYMFAGKKAKTANRAELKQAKREAESGQQTGEMIRRRTGWHQGPDGKWRFEIDDSKARFGDESSNRLGDFLLHEELYEAYPELREIKVEKLGEDAPERLRGRYLADEKKIQYNPNLSQKERMKVMLHEIQHIIQRTEGLGKGGSQKLAERYLFNRAYDYAKTLPSYQSMQTPKQREQFVKDLIAARSHSGDYETAVTEAYRNLFGEIEARNTANRQPLDQRGRQLASPANPKESIVVTDWNEEIRRYKGNQEEMSGAIEPSEADMYNQDKGGEMHDEERDAESAAGIREHKPAIRRGSRTDMDIRGEHGIRSRTLRTGEGIAGESESRGGGIRGEERRDEASTRRDESLGRSGLDQPRLQLKDPEEGTPGYAELLSKWGSIKPGYKPFRHVSVPKQSSDTQKVRRFVRSVMESNAVTDEMVEDLKGEIVKGAMSYTVISDKTAQNAAKKILDEEGVKGAWKHWNSIVNGDKFPEKKDIVLGEYLLRAASEHGDKKEVMRLAGEISELGTRMGQNVQALSLLKKMGGAGRLVYVQRTVDTLNKDLSRRFKKKAIAKIKLNEQLAEDLVNATTQEEIEAAQQELYKDIADQLPPTWVDKWNAWRYLSMLGNPKTHIRNILGNAVFAPVVRIKDSIGAGMEAMFIKDGERTKTALPAGKEYREFAKQDFLKMQDVIRSGGKMNPEDAIRDQRTIFKTRWLETLRKKNFEFMEIEDGWFLKAHYENALAQYLQANKTDLSKMTEGQLERARNYAIQEAQKATFRDASPLANAIKVISHMNKVAGVAIEGVLPFKKTPINVLKRGVEYSPAGLLYTLSRGSLRLKRGEITVSEYIDGLASGLTGTGIAAMGALLGGLGWISGGFGDDKEDEFEKLQGRQDYALQIGGITYTVDWMAPSAIPFFVGVELINALRGEYEEVPTRAVVDALLNIAEPMFNLSMMDGLNNTLNAVSFSDNKFLAIAGEVVSGYVLQAIPSVSGQIARSVDPTRRRTYADKNSPIPESFQTAYQKLFNKIPGLSYLNQPYIDEWGRTDKTGFLWAAFENLVSPGWISNINTSDMEQELLRLYEATGESGVLPGYAAKSITVNGEKLNLTGDEYTQFSEIRGQTAYSTISEIMSSEEYEGMSDAQKVKAIKDAFEFAGSAAKAAISEYELEGWQQDANEESQEEGIAIGEAIAHRAATNGAAPEIAATLEEEGAQAAQERIDRMMKACESRDEMREQKGNVKSAITRAYKKQYIKCHENGDTAGMRKIREELMELRTPVGKLYTMKDFRNWINN